MTDVSGESLPYNGCRPNPFQAHAGPVILRFFTQGPLIMDHRGAMDCRPPTWEADGRRVERDPATRQENNRGWPPLYFLSTIRQQRE